MLYAFSENLGDGHPELDFFMSSRSPNITLLYLLKFQHLEYPLNENKLSSIFTLQNLFNKMSIVSKKPSFTHKSNKCSEVPATDTGLSLQACPQGLLNDNPNYDVIVFLLRILLDSLNV